MSDLIPSISITDFRKLKVEQIRELKACEVLSDGELLFTAIIPHGDLMDKENIRVPAERLALRANIIGGKDPEELIKEKADAVV